MCLLIALSRSHEGFPLVVAANRDELLDRPAVAMTVLRDARPRILGGRDELAGGTWLAVNDFGVVAGLTNRPTTEGRDPSKRSRGELPLGLARHSSAAEAVDWFTSTVEPGDYNPAWLLVGDRAGLFFVEVADGSRARSEALEPGVHVLENRPPQAFSPKVEQVRRLLAGTDGLPIPGLERRLEAALRDHEVPSVLEPALQEGDGRVRPVATEAACVHAEAYGTRWSALIAVPEAGGPPKFRYAPGPPCTTAFRDATAMWTTKGAAEEASTPGAT